jgi:hypothetical protein
MRPKMTENTQTNQKMNNSDKFHFNLENHRNIDVSKITRSKAKNMRRKEQVSGSEKIVRIPMKDEEIQTNSCTSITPETRTGKVKHVKKYRFLRYKI